MLVSFFLGSLRQALKNKQRFIVVPYTKDIYKIIKILCDRGIIYGYTCGSLGSVELLLNTDSKFNFKMISTPRKRVYISASKLPVVCYGLGFYLLHTSLGFITDDEARLKNVGGEPVCCIF